MRLLLSVFLAFSLLAQEHGADAHAGGMDDVTRWKWINFAILAAGLGFLILKFAAPALRGQKRQIAGDLAEAQRLRTESEAKVAEIDRKLGNLQGEIEAFRQESARLLAAEAERVRKETADQTARLQAQAEQEVAALGRAAAADLKAEAARLAVEIAEKRLSEGLTPETHAGLIRGFAADLRKGNQ